MEYNSNNSMPEKLLYALTRFYTEDYDAYDVVEFIECELECNGYGTELASIIELNS